MISVEINSHISRRVKCLEHKLEWVSLSYNSRLPWAIIEAYPDKPWNWEWISRNPNITWDIIIINPDKPWNWYHISANPNMLISTLDIYDIIRRYMAVRTIQKTWRHVNTNPSYNVCRCRLFREYNELVE